jgi:hypothetical protein
MRNQYDKPFVDRGLGRNPPSSWNKGSGSRERDTDMHRRRSRDSPKRDYKRRGSRSRSGEYVRREKRDSYDDRRKGGNEQVKILVKMGLEGKEL